MQQAAAVQVASTASLPAADRFPYWADVVAQLFVPLECDTPMRRNFSGSVRHRQVGRVGVTDVQASTLLARRTRAKISRAPSDDLIVVIHVDGRCNVGQRSNAALLHPGDGAVVSTDDMYYFDFPNAFRQLVLKVPRVCLYGAATGVRSIRLADCPAKFLRQLAFAALDQPGELSAAEGAAIERALTELLLLAVAPATKGHDDAGSQRYAAALDFIQRSLGDPGLDPATVAAHLGLSARSVGRLFAAHGKTIERTIWLARLTAARDDLADPRQGNRSITEVAFSRGFNDAAHFSRSFASAYGLTPTQFRVQCLSTLRSQ
jgi:AraC-like DNA-binding protein